MNNFCGSCKFFLKDVNFKKQKVDFCQVENKYVNELFDEKKLSYLFDFSANFEMDYINIPDPDKGIFVFGVQLHLFPVKKCPAKCIYKFERDMLNEF